VRNPKTELVYSKRFSGNPKISIAIPFYNQERIIARNLKSVIDNLQQVAEILLIDDSSTDYSMRALMDFISSLDATTELKLSSISVFQNRNAQYETYCDAFLFANCNSRYVIEIQSDMQILHKGFDLKLLRAVTSSAHLIAVSARGIEPVSGVIKGYSKTLGSDRAHSYSIVRYVISRVKYQIFSLLKPNVATPPLVRKPESRVLYNEVMDSEFLTTGYAGRIASKINYPVDEDYAQKDVIFIGETIMRGPIIVDKEKYMAVGGFDSERFFQGYDEHELFIKAYLLLGYRVGYTPIDFSSPLEEGSTRKRRSLSGEFQILRQLLRIMNKRKSSTLWTLLQDKTSPEYQSEIKSFS